MTVNKTFRRVNRIRSREKLSKRPFKSHVVMFNAVDRVFTYSESFMNGEKTTGLVLKTALLH